MSVLIDIKCGDPKAAAARFQLAGYMLAYGASADALTFDPAGHIYRHRDTGAIVPGVTTILKDCGISADFEGLSQLCEQIGRAVALKRDIGTAVHQAAHYFDDNDLALDSVDPQVMPYLDAWMTFRANYPHLRPATRERLVYHPAYRYAGTLDGIFLLTDETEIAIDHRWSVQLTPGRKVPYRVTEYIDHYGDMETFKAIVTTWHHQARRAA